MNKVVLVKKPNMERLEFDNVVQVDVINMAELDGEVSDDGWNLIDIIQKERGEVKKTVVKMKDVWQLLLVEDKGEQNGR